MMPLHFSGSLHWGRSPPDESVAEDVVDCGSDVVSSATCETSGFLFPSMLAPKFWMAVPTCSTPWLISEKILPKTGFEWEMDRADDKNTTNRTAFMAARRDLDRVRTGITWDNLKYPSTTFRIIPSVIIKSDYFRGTWSLIWSAHFLATGGRTSPTCSRSIYFLETSAISFAEQEITTIKNIWVLKPIWIWVLQIALGPDRPSD